MAQRSCSDRGEGTTTGGTQTDSEAERLEEGSGIRGSRKREEGSRGKGVGTPIRIYGGGGRGFEGNVKR